MAIIRNNRKNSRFARQDRLLTQVTASLHSNEPDKSTRPAKTLDISKRGLRIMGNDSIPVGAMVDLWVEIAGLKGKFYLNSEVRWSKLDKRLGYVMGLELCEGLGSDITHWERLFEKKSSTRMHRKTSDAWGNAL